MHRAFLLGPVIAMSIALAWAALPEADRVRVDVVSMDDPGDQDRVTSLVLRLTNVGGQGVRPVFSIPANALVNQYAWKIEAGPDELEPGQQAEYTITQSPYVGIPVNTGFRVLVRDLRDDNLVGASDITMVQMERPVPAALNPGFGSWERSMFWLGRLPFAWSAVGTTHGDDRWRLEQHEQGVTLAIEPDGNRTAGDWTMIALRQRVDMPQRLNIGFVEGDRGDFAAGPSTMVGVLLEDLYAQNSLIVLFSNSPTDADQLHETLLRFRDAQSYRILVTNRSADVDIVQLWQDQGWSLPAKRWVVEEAAQGPGDVGVGARQVSVGTDQLVVIRPMELKVLVASYPPHQYGLVEATFSYVGGPAWDPSDDRRVL